MPPVDVAAIARGRGIDIRYEAFDDNVSGVLVRQAGRSTIGVSSAQSEVRQRFTIAHELGHFLLHQGHELHVDKSFSVNWRRSKEGGDADPVEIEEVEANAFAACLLMPEEMLNARRDSMVFDLEDETEIQRLATQFKVSRQAMNFRLFNLYRRSGA
ncbi:MAG TPA: ImmA/IrrE family metallo-endopeptidase [Solimonas sp.]